MRLGWTKCALIFGMLPLCCLARLQRVKGSFDIYTQRVDNQRSGVNLVETELNQSNVKTRFGKLWTLYSDAKIMAQPLYVSHLTSTKCPQGCNTVIFASMNNTVYAYVADQKPRSSNDTLVWSRNLGPVRAGARDIDEWAVDDPSWGILGTPAIDVDNNVLYVVAWNDDQMYRLYALNLHSGEIVNGPVVIEGSVEGESFTEHKAKWHQTRKQRAGLLLDHGELYVAFGFDNPKGIAGWLFVYDGANLQLRTVWSPEPKGKGGGIWMSGTGPVADGAGNIYLETANGDFDASRNQYGNSMLRLRLKGDKLDVVDYFTPCNQSYLNRKDLDMGSIAPLLLPGNTILGGGKFGALYLMSRDRFGRYEAGGSPRGTECRDSDQILQKVDVSRGHIHGMPIYWKGPNGTQWIYVMPETQSLAAYPFVDGRFKTASADIKSGGWKPPGPAPASCHRPPHDWMPGGILAVSSDADRQGTGIVWALVPADGDSNSYRGVKGMLLALNAEDVSQELWRSQGRDAEIDTPDGLGLLARFVPPTVANGKVFVANAGDREDLKRYCGTRPTQFPNNYAVVVYGLKN
jgi:hypothetical protein